MIHYFKDTLVTLTNSQDIDPSADDETHDLVDSALVADVLSLDPLSPITRTLNAGAGKPFDMEAKSGIKNLMIKFVGDVISLLLQ